VRVNAEWSVLRAEANRNPAGAYTSRLSDLARRSTGVVSESGAPLPDLALLLALRRLPSGELPPVLIAELRRRVVESPSFLTSALVEEAVRVAPADKDAVGLRERWAANDRALDLLRGLSVSADKPAETWVSTEQGDWLAFVHPLVATSDTRPLDSRTAQHVTFVPAALVERLFRSAVLPRDNLPSYLAARVQLGGRTLRATERQRASTPPVEFASAPAQLQVPLVLPSDAAGTFAGELLRIAPQAIAVRQEAPGGVVRLTGVAGAHPFTLVLELTAPDLLYASYRVRWWMAVGLILVATLAAFAGLAAAWRAFLRERRLAEMKSDFVANVSHELRAPVAAVRLMAESLERGTVEQGERQHEYLRLIGQECRRLSALVANVLDFSRIDRGRRQYTFERADVQALVVETADVMRAYAEQRQVKLVCAPLPAGTTASLPRVDRAALQQALVNLVDNAIKHSPGGAEVVVGLEVDRGDVRLSVEDHGPGIPIDEQERIFEPFYRVESGLRRETQGVGIGLSIVRHVAEAHGGRVVVRSSPGQGSRFGIELPVDRENGPSRGR
jgi:signal transduction histidine kinase